MRINTGKLPIASKRPKRSAPCTGNSLASAARCSFLLRSRSGVLSIPTGHDHALHVQNTVSGKKHVFGAAEANALGAEPSGEGCVARNTRVHPYTELSEFVRPENHPSDRAIERNPVALLDSVPTHLQYLLLVGNFCLTTAGGCKACPYRG